MSKQIEDVTAALEEALLALEAMTPMASPETAMDDLEHAAWMEKSSAINAIMKGAETAAFSALPGEIQDLLTKLRLAKSALYVSPAKASERDTVTMTWSGEPEWVIHAIEHSSNQF